MKNTYNINIKAISGSIYPRSYNVEKNIIKIGRSKSSDIVIDNKKVSRKHARIVHSAGMYIIEDLGSRNGTYVNGLKITKSKKINIGDSITIGDSKFNLVHHSAEVNRINKLLLVAVIAIIVALISAIVIPTYFYTKNKKFDISPADTEETHKGDPVETESEELLAEGEMLKENEYFIEEEGIILEVNEDSLYQDDRLKITEFENNILVEDEYAVFSDTIFTIEFENSDYFNKPVKITLKYDESMIPQGASEYSIFVAFDDGIGNIFYKGGEINEENNTITVDTFHASSWWTGILRKGLNIFSGDTVKKEELDGYTEKKMKYFEEAVELLATNPNYSTREGAMEELDKAYTDWYEWIMTADIAVKRLESVNPLHSLEQLTKYAIEVGLGALTEQTLLLSADILLTIPGRTAGIGSAYLTAAGKVVGIVSYIQAGILIGENIGYSASVVEKIIRMKMAAKNYRIADVASEYSGNKWRFLADVKLARELGMDISEDTVNKIISNFELAEEGSTQEEESEPEPDPQYSEITNISYTVIYGPVIENGYCVYRVKVNITGDYKVIRWNKDDSNGAWGPDVAQINIPPGDSFDLKVYIDNYFDGVEIYSEDFNYVGPEPEPEPESEPEPEPELETKPDFPPVSSITIYSDGSWDNAVICTYSPPTNPISGAEWIWAPGWPSSCTVSKTFNIAGDIDSAIIKITVDNYFILYVNGSEVARKDSDPAWDRVDTYNIKSFLHSGSNTVSVKGWNEYNQVGISVKIQIN